MLHLDSSPRHTDGYPHGGACTGKTAAATVREIGFSNPAVAVVRKIIASGGKPHDNQCVLDGYWALQKAADAGMRIRSFFFCGDFLESETAWALHRRYLALADECYSVSAKTFEKLSDRDDPCGMIAVADFPIHTPEEMRGTPILVVLDHLETPGNIGTILRSCDGAGIGGALIVNQRVRFTHPKLIKGSMGAAFSVPMASFENVAACRTWLAANGYTVYLADTRAEKSLGALEYRFPAALVCGSERYGISQEWYDGSEQLVKIPMRGTGDSLNVGVAASIFLYDMAVQLDR